MTWKQSMRQGSAEVKMDITAEYVRLGVPVDVDLLDGGEVFDATYLALQPARAGRALIEAGDSAPGRPAARRRPGGVRDHLPVSPQRRHEQVLKILGDL